jgi:chromosome segregation ATPase
MKTKILIFLLIIICAGLVVGLISIKQDAEKQHKDDLDKIELGSNQLNEVNGKLQDEKQNALVLQKDLAARRDDIAKLSNDLATATDNIAKTQADLKASQEETAKRDAKITQLEDENTALDKQASDLKGSISSLEVQIADTKKKLDASEGDKAFLQKELVRLTAEKRELENQFNDLLVVRAQVKKLKEQLSLSHRLEWIRQGIFARNEQKGAQRLLMGAMAVKQPSPPEVSPTNAVDLNVEVSSDGSVKVISPLTNTAPPEPTPPAGK